MSLLNYVNRLINKTESIDSVLNSAWDDNCFDLFKGLSLNNKCNFSIPEINEIEYNTELNIDLNLFITYYNILIKENNEKKFYKILYSLIDNCNINEWNLWYRKILINYFNNKLMNYQISYNDITILRQGDSERWVMEYDLYNKDILIYPYYNTYVRKVSYDDNGYLINDVKNIPNENKYKSNVYYKETDDIIIFDGIEDINDKLSQFETGRILGFNITNYIVVKGKDINDNLLEELHSEFKCTEIELCHGNIKSKFKFDLIKNKKILLDGIKDKNIEDYIINHNGILLNKFSPDIDILITKYKNSSKIKKAKEHHILIYDVEKLI